MKIFWGIVGVVLLVMVLALPTFRAWVVNLFVLVSTLNASFFSVMPAWFNFLILTVVIAFVLVIANSFRK